MKTRNYMRFTVARQDRGAGYEFSEVMSLGLGVRFRKWEETIVSA
jgi:hypothetical protein